MMLVCRRSSTVARSLARGFQAGRSDPERLTRRLRVARAPVAPHARHMSSSTGPSFPSLGEQIATELRSGRALGIISLAVTALFVERWLRGEGESAEVHHVAKEEDPVEEKSELENLAGEGPASETGGESEGPDGGGGGGSPASGSVEEEDNAGQDVASGKSAAEKVDDILSVTSDKVKGGGDFVETTAKTLTEEAGGEVEGVVDRVSKGAATAVEKLGDILEVGVRETPEAIQWLLPTATSDKLPEVTKEGRTEEASTGASVEGAAETISAAASDTGGAVKSWAGSVADATTREVPAAAATVTDTVRNVVEEGQTRVEEGLDSAEDAVEAGGENLAKAADEVAQAATDGAPSAVGSAVDTARRAVGQESVSDGVGVVKDAVQSEAPQGVKGAVEAVEAGKDEVVEGAQNLKEASKEELASGAEAVSERVSDAERSGEESFADTIEAVETIAASVSRQINSSIGDVKEKAQKEAEIVKDEVCKKLPGASETFVQNVKAGGDVVNETINEAREQVGGSNSLGGEILSDVATAAVAVVSGGVAAVQDAVDGVTSVVLDYVGAKKPEEVHKTETDEVTETEGGEEEEESCPFCKFMKAGPCGKEFSSWEKCVDDAEAVDKDIVTECKTHTQAMTVCMEANTEYYSPVLETGQGIAAQAGEAVDADVKEAEIVEAGSIGDVVADLQEEKK